MIIYLQNKNIASLLANFSDKSQPGSAVTLIWPEFTHAVGIANNKHRLRPAIFASIFVVPKLGVTPLNFHAIKIKNHN